MSFPIKQTMLLERQNNDAKRSMVIPTDPRKVRKWHKELPMINMGETTHIVYDYIRELNEIQINARDRLEIMEILRDTCIKLTRYLDKHLTLCSYPLVGKQRQVAKLTETIHYSIADSYFKCVSDAVNGKHLLDKRLIARAIHRGIRFLSIGEKKRLQIYQDFSPTFWTLLHQLYSIAEEQRVTDTTVEDSSLKSRNASTVEDVYKQICLLALSHPHRLRNGNADKLFRFFEHVVNDVKISKQIKADKNNAITLISLKSDQPPCYMSLANVTAFSNLRGLNLTVMLEKIRDILDNEESTAYADCRLPSYLCRHLFKVLTSIRKRQFSRIESTRKLSIAISLNGIIDSMNADTDPNLSKDILFSATVASKMKTINNNWQRNATQSILLQDMEDAGKLDINTQQDLPKCPDAWQDWYLRNTSAGGYSLHWNTASKTNAQVSELVAIREKEGNRYQWRVGQIRWLKNTDANGLDIGIKVIAPRAVIVSITKSSRLGDNSLLPINAIMLPGMKTISQPPSIIVPSNMFKTHDELRLNMLGRQLKIDLQEEVEIASYFTQFHYKSFDLDAPPTVETSFNELWTKL